MTDINDFVEFVGKERLALESEVQTRDLLSIRALVSLGHAVSGLRIINCNNDTLQLACTENQSRFRPGDRLIFKHELLPAFRATLYDVSDHGRKLHVRGSKLPEVEGIGEWLAIEDTTDLTFSVQTALRKLQPGAPGWRFTKQLLGQASIPETHSDQVHERLLFEMIAESDLSLDSSQTEVFLKCTALPAIMGVQGPPGTGKTLLLAFVAEALLRLGKRVILLAPTHQAVIQTIRDVEHMNRFWMNRAQLCKCRNRQRFF